MNMQITSRNDQNTSRSRVTSSRADLHAVKLAEIVAAWTFRNHLRAIDFRFTRARLTARLIYTQSLNNQARRSILVSL